MSGYKQRQNRKGHKGKRRERGGRNNRSYQQPSEVCDYEVFQTETVTEADLDQRLFQRPSFAHLDIQDDHDSDSNERTIAETCNRSSGNRTHYGLGYKSDFFTNQPTKGPTALGGKAQEEETVDTDSFYMDSQPSDIVFEKATTVFDSTEGFQQQQQEEKTQEESSPSDKTVLTPIHFMLEDNRKKAKQLRKKKRSAQKIIPGDDIHISFSDEDDYPTTVRSQYNSKKYSKNENKNRNEVDDERAALDQDFMENTDPETWQLMQQWTTSMPVDDQQHGQLGDDENTEEDDSIDDSSYAEDEGKSNQKGSILKEEDFSTDFGLVDSDEDEFLCQYAAQQRYQLQLAEQFQYTIQNTIPVVPPSLHAGMHGYLNYNQQYITYSNNNSNHHSNYKGTHTSINGELRRVDRRVQLFISDPSRTTYQLPAMSTYCRRVIQGLVTNYKLKLSHEQLEDNKIGLLLKKGPNTHLPSERQQIEKYINKVRSPERAKKRMQRRPGGERSRVIREQRRVQRGKLKEFPETVGRPSSQLAAHPIIKPKHGTVVGSTAAPLTSENIGHKMMAAMGWNIGESLGTKNEGIVNPIKAVVRTKRRGLGA